MRTIVAVAVVAAIAGRHQMRRPELLRSRSGHAEASDDRLLLAELTALGLSAGHTFPLAVDAAALRVPALQNEVRALLRNARRVGLAAVLGDESAPGLFRIAARATVTGAPLLPAVLGHVDELRAADRQRRLERIRKLPVKLLFPLALLILPGFLVLLVSPALLGALDRLRF